MRKYGAGPKQRSGPHRRVETFLDELGLNYESEVHFSPFTVDIYLPEWHIAIEVDGPLHSKGKDSLRDGFLMSDHFLPILRINAEGWMKKDDVLVMITKFVERQADSAEDRKSSARLRS